MRRRILFLVVGMTTLVVLAFAIPLAVLIRHNTYQDAIRTLEGEAADVARFVQQEGTAPTTEQLTSYLGGLEGKGAASVLTPAGTLLGERPPGDLEHLLERYTPGSDEDSGPESEHERRPPPQATARSWSGGKLISLAVPARPQDYVVFVWAADGTVYEAENGWFALLAAVAVALLLLGIGAGELLTRRIVRPLIDTARTAQQLSTGDTAARAPTDGPAEVADVGKALNRLADRIDELIAEERETVADLSHRLRTPLTALRLDAEALRDPVEAERMGGHATTLERMLTAVIHAARRPQREGRMPACDATAVVGERVAFWSALTEDQQRPSTVQLPASPVPVRASGEDLAAAVDALLSNVVAHTPEGTAFAVRLTAREGGARLEISDEGPGLPVQEPVRGRSDRGSSGLGLDIARSCAEASGGSMTIDTGPSGGALITLELGAP